jgi:hypothetical protein
MCVLGWNGLEEQTQEVAGARPGVGAAACHAHQGGGGGGGLGPPTCSEIDRAWRDGRGCENGCRLAPVCGLAQIEHVNMQALGRAEIEEET